MNKIGSPPGPRPHAWRSGPDPVAHAQYRAYIQQRNQAQFRGEIWNLTLAEWRELWADLWPLRGRGREDYCMTRRDWTGDWTVDNTHVITRRQHAQMHGRHRFEGYRSPARERWLARLHIPPGRPGRPRKVPVCNE